MMCPHDDIGHVHREVGFIREFRGGGLRWAQYACLAAGTLLLLFLLLPDLSIRHTPSAVYLRSGMLAVVFTVGYVVHRHTELAIRWYVGLIGGTCALVYLGLVALVTVYDVASNEAGFSPMPAVLFGLFIGYGFLRLPLAVIATIGWTFSFLVVLLAPAGFSGDGDVRLLLYVTATNLLGMILCHSIETRERELFIHRRRAEAAQAELKKRAVAAEEAHMEKTRLLAAVSHDLRQPMMAMNNYLSVLGNRLRHRDFELADRQVARLQGAIGLLDTTLDHLLTAARHDSGTEPLKLEMIELEPLLQQLRDTFAPEAARRGVQLRVRFPSTRIVVTTDATALWRVLMNLVANAIKFTEPAPGRGVAVRARLTGNRCRIDVADTGIGIPAEHVNAIWEAYFQVGNSERDRSRGLGLGLFLVRRTLDRLPDHRLALRSKAGRGSRFSIELPGARLADGPVARSSRDHPSTEDLDSLRGAYVLVLEDDHEARRAILALLDDWGVLHASGATPEELLADAETSPRIADALISDFRLPGGRNGGECIGLVRSALDDAVPAIVVTAESDLSVVRATVPSGTQVLQKPFASQDLAAFLRTAIVRSRRLEQDETALDRREL